MMHFLKPEAKKHLETLLEEYSIPESQQDGLIMGVYYLYEWYRIAQEQQEMTTSDRDAERLNPILRYQKPCWECWERCAKEYGLTPQAERKLAGRRKSIAEKNDLKSGGVPFRRVKPHGT